MKFLPTLRPHEEVIVTPEPLVEVDILDDGRPCMVVDHPRQWRMVVDPRVDVETLAAAMNTVLRANAAQGHWSRDSSGLWVNR